MSIVGTINANCKQTCPLTVGFLKSEENNIYPSL